MKAIWITAIGAAIYSGSVMAEKKVLTVGKMHCQDCVATLKEKLCGISSFAKCEVKILNEKKEIGQVTLVTKGSEKIDMKKVAQIIGDEGYDLKK